MAECRVFGENDIRAVSDFLRAGGVLAYPTESVWGLGCDAFNGVAIEKIFQLKSRPMQKALIVLTDDVDKIVPLLSDLPDGLQADLLKKMRDWYECFDPNLTAQARTWLIPKSKSVHLPFDLTGGLDTLAVRVTHHLGLAKICQALTTKDNPQGFLVSTSCNLSGRPAATTLEQAMAYFGNQVAYLDAPTMGFVQPSQIVDVITDCVIR